MNFFAASMFVAVMAATAFAGALPFSSSNGTTTSGSLSFTQTLATLPDSSTPTQNTVSGSFSVSVPFSFSLTLPSASDYVLSSASLTFQPNNFSTQLSQNPTSTTKLTNACSFGCSFTEASLNLSGFDTASLTQVSSPTQTKSVGGTSLDLLALGFGSDLINGGTLTLSGIRQIQISEGINFGFNDSTTFSQSFSDSRTESASLSLDGALATPEPRAYSVLLVAGLLGLSFILQRRARKS